DTDLAVVEIHDSVDSPSRTLIVLIKESNGSGALPLQPNDTVKGHRKVARSVLHDKDMEAARKEFSITIGERLPNAMLEEHEKIEKVSFIRQSLSEDFDAYNDADLMNSDDLTDLEQKKERLEAMRQDLINYKLCLY
ncbi:hypothetical protein HAX54_049902, partial [Datura stramonium]|nr:hypothetical protein [Datura stramonium]